MTTTETESDLETDARALLEYTTDQLVELRAEREALNARGRVLVAREKSLKRVIAVFDRANAKAKPAE